MTVDPLQVFLVNVRVSHPKADVFTHKIDGHYYSGISTMVGYVPLIGQVSAKIKRLAYMPYAPVAIGGDEVASLTALRDKIVTIHPITSYAAYANYVQRLWSADYTAPLQGVVPDNPFAVLDLFKDWSEVTLSMHLYRVPGQGYTALLMANIDANTDDQIRTYTQTPQWCEILNKTDFYPIGVGDSASEAMQTLIDKLKVLFPKITPSAVYRLRWGSLLAKVMNSLNQQDSSSMQYFEQFMEPLSLDTHVFKHHSITNPF